MAMEGYRGFLALLVSALLVGFLSVIFTLIWVLHYREGLGWDGTALEFNWHPVLLVTGFVFILGIAIIVYRLPWTWKCSKLLMKSIHAGLNTVAAILAIISLVAVFDFHNAKKIPNMYSLHSWVGLTAVILYILQVSISVKRPAYSSLPPEGVFTNTLGLLILVFGALIFWIVTRPQWKRPKEPNSVLFQPNGGAPEGVESSVAMNFGNVDKSDSELNNEAAARKRNITLDEAGQRSTM
ncbi:hypothetical protein FD754_006492 [Muntiacus muntjak]|uniref:Plasma membrane ascorbate-dependent reductase CYBRD1 n=1 Tax=Muntiacus muntjak TaxID=9888 RepID=A0A5N3WQ19_MUNMU|nr:hypothetical protein FD754_006492 [Muntiacus muntjak]